MARESSDQLLSFGARFRGMMSHTIGAITAGTCDVRQVDAIVIQRRLATINAITCEPHRTHRTGEILGTQQRRTRSEQVTPSDPPSRG